MKYLLFLVLLILLSSTTYADARYRAFEAAYFQIGLEPVKLYDLNILIVIDIDKLKIDIYGKEELHIDITSKGNGYITDENGNDKFTLQGVDQTGKACSIRMILFNDKNLNTANLSIEYPSWTLVYKLKDNG